MLSVLCEGTVIWILLSVVVHVLLDSWFCEVGGTGIGKIEDPVPRSGSEESKDAGRSPRPASIELTSLLASLRARRCFRGRRRRSRSPMSLLSEVDGGSMANGWPRGFPSFPAGARDWHIVRCIFQFSKLHPSPLCHLLCAPIQRLSPSTCHRLPTP